MTADDIAALQALEDRRYDAMLAADTAALGDLLHDDLVYMHSTGGSDSRKSYLAALGDGTVVYKAVVHDDLTVRVHNDIGMVFHHMEADVVIRGAAHHLDNRLLAVWSRDGG